jgi:hypothetical protein
MADHGEDISFLRQVLAEFLEKQSSSALTEKQKKTCKAGIRALNSAIDALQSTVYA